MLLIFIRYIDMNASEMNIDFSRLAMKAAVYIRYGLLDVVTVQDDSFEISVNRSAHSHIA